LYKNSSKYGTDTTTEWQTADGLHVDTPKKEEKGRPGVKWAKEIYYAMAEKGLDEVQWKWLEKIGDWKTEKVIEVNEQTGWLTAV